MYVHCPNLNRCFKWHSSGMCCPLKNSYNIFILKNSNSFQWREILILYFNFHYVKHFSFVDFSTIQSILSPIFSCACFKNNNVLVRDGGGGEGVQTIAVQVRDRRTKSVCRRPLSERILMVRLVIRLARMCVYLWWTFYLRQAIKGPQPSRLLTI